MSARTPARKLSFSDHDRHRFQAILTDHPEADIAVLEGGHHARARVEDRIRAAKDTGLENLRHETARCGNFWPGVEAPAHRDRGFLGDA